MLTIRLTRNASDLTSFFTKLDSVCNQSIWFEHVKSDRVSRTHVHGLIDGLTVSVETLKNWLRFDTLWAPTNGWDKSDWSFKNKYKSPMGTKPVDVHMITYMSKGILHPVHVHGFSDWIQYKNAWIEPHKRQTTLDENKQELPVLEKQITQWEMLEQMNAILQQRKEVNPEDVVEVIIKVHNIHHKLISRYKVRDFYDTIMSQRCFPSFAQDILFLCKKI